MAALGLKAREKVLTAGPDKVTWEPCYSDEDVRKIIGVIEDAMKRAEAAASSSAEKSQPSR